MGPVARAILGAPTECNRQKGELRFGSRGSLSVDLGAGTFYDHEAGAGGGVLDFVQQRMNTDKAGALAWLQEHGHIEKPTLKKPKIVAIYDYVAANGDPLFQVVRLEPKDFRQRHSDGNGGWVWNMKGVQRVLYCLPAITALEPGSRAYVVEGEKSADALAALGLTATCSPGGANKWRGEYAVCLHNLDVVVLPDGDDPGRQHAAMVAKSLTGIAKRVRTLELPGLPDKGDVVDWIAAGGTPEVLEELVEAIVEQQAKPQENFEPAIRAIITEFNDLYLLVNEAGKAIIYQPDYDPVLKRRRFDRLSIGDLQALYLNRQVQVGLDEKKRPVYKGVADVWLATRTGASTFAALCSIPACKRRPVC